MLAIAFVNLPIFALIFLGAGECRVYSRADSVQGMAKPPD